MPDSFDWRIVDRHLSGESTEADDAALRRWLDDDPRNAELLRAAGAAASVGVPDERWKVDAAWSRLSERLERSDAPPLHGTPTVRPLRFPARRHVSRVTPLRVAAVTAALVAASVVAVYWSAPSPRAATDLAPSTTEMAAADGQQIRLTLHDGTRVLLNAGSRLRYASDFGRAAREVELDGEAYFDVVHDEAHPFRVRARGSVAEDIGTRFVVRAYAERPRVEVVVEEGSVSLRPDRATAHAQVLGAGQLGRLELDGSVTVVNDADVERWLGWTHGALVLDGLTLADAAVEIGRRFDVHVDVKDPALAARTVTARFRDEPLPRVLDALVVAMGAHWTRDGQRIAIERGER